MSLQLLLILGIVIGSVAFLLRGLLRQGGCASGCGSCKRGCPSGRLAAAHPDLQSRP